MFAEGPDYHAQLETYGHVIRILHRARVNAVTPIGWWSWTAYYFGLSQRAAITNLEWLSRNLKDLGFVYFHIDEGYQYARGEYATPDAALFPDGMKYVGSAIRDHGLTFGIWTAPFEVSQRSWVFEHHQDWLVHGGLGTPIQIGYVTDHTEPVYVLDTTNPGAQQYLRQTYRTLVQDWGVRFILDFMDDSAVEGHYYRPATTALEAQRMGLQIIREAVGNDIVLDKDGSPMLNPVGIVDAGRISEDTGHRFDASKTSAPGIAARYYMNRTFFISDPDAFTVSREVLPRGNGHGQEPATLQEAQVSIALAAISGGMYEIGDDLPTLGLDPDRVALVRNLDLLNMVRTGRASRPVDLMSYSVKDQMPSIFFLQEDKHQSILTLFNWTEQGRSHTIQFSDLGLPANGKYHAYDVLENGASVPLSERTIAIENQPPHSVRIIKIVNDLAPTGAPSITGSVPASAVWGENIALSAQADEAGVPAVRYRWEFGDGTEADGMSVRLRATRLHCFEESNGKAHS
jgi:alpha-galactosidase